MTTLYATPTTRITLALASVDAPISMRHAIRTIAATLDEDGFDAAYTMTRDLHSAIIRQSVLNGPEIAIEQVNRERATIAAMLTAFETANNNPDWI